jgi:hypothetical protein
MDSTPDDSLPVTIELVPVQSETVAGNDFAALVEDTLLDMMQQKARNGSGR